MKKTHWIAGMAAALLAAGLTIPVASVHALMARPVWKVQQDDRSAAGDSKSVDQEKPGNDKALKYHSALRRRPTPGYLYDRFYLAWLETSSISQLQQFLTSNAEASGEAADHLLLAFFHVKQGQEVDALKQFQLALSKDPGNAETLLEKARVEARTLDLDAAIEDLAKAAASQPKAEVAIEIAQFRGKLLLRLRKVEEAAQVLQQLLAEHGSDQRLVEDVVELQVNEGLYEEALTTLEGLIQKTTDPYQLVMRQLRKADILQLSGKRDEALAQYASTLEQSGRDTWLEREILAQVQQVFQREDDVQGLLTYLQKLETESGQRSAVMKTIAGLHVQLGDTDSALKQFEKILEAAPGDRVNREAMIELLTESGQVERAIQQMTQLLQQEANPELYLKLAQLQGTAGLDAETIGKTLRSYLKENESTEFAFQRAARMGLSLNQNALAESLYRESVETHSESLTAKENLAAFLYDHEKKEEAVTLWKAMAEGADKTQLARVAKILSTRGENQTAFELLKQQESLVTGDQTLLALLCSEAMTLKEYSSAVPWVMQRVRLAESSSELESSLTQAAQVLGRAQQTQAIAEELAKQSDRKVNETCLMIELWELLGKRNEAQTLLEEQFSAAVDAADGPAIQKLGNQQIRLHSVRQDWLKAAETLKRLQETTGGRTSENARRLVELYQRAGDYEAALTATQQWKEINASNVAPWMLEANLLDRLGKPEQAIVVLRSATQKFPEDQDLFAKLGQLYEIEGQHKEAERVYWVRYEESKDLGERIRWAERLAKVADETGETEQLVEDLEKRRRTNPQSVEPVLALAQVYRVTDNYQGRRGALMDALRLQPKNLLLLQEIARIEAEESDWDKAIATLQEALKIEDRPELHRQLAQVYLEYGEPELGYQELLNAVGGGQASWREIEKLTDAMMSNQDWESARDFLQSQFATRTPDYRVKYQLAVALYELDQGEAALELFLELLSGQEEIANLPVVPAKSMGFRLDAYEEALPKETAELMQLFFASMEAFSHRDNSFGMRMSMFGGGGGSTVSLPADVQDCRRMSLCFLSEIAQDMEAGDRQALVDQLGSRGDSLAKLVASPGFELQELQGSESDLFELFPGNDGVLGLAVIGGLSREDDRENAETYAKQALERFPESEGTIRLIALMILVRGEPDVYREQVKMALEQVSQQEPTELMLGILASTIMDEDSFLPEELQSEVNQLWIEWYPKLAQRMPPGYSDYLMARMVSSLREEDPGKLLLFLEQQALVAPQNQNSAAAMQMQMYYGGGPLQVPQFPPETLTGIKPSLLNSIGFHSEESDYSPFADEGGSLEDQQWLDKFGPHLDKVKDPVLSMLLQLKKRACELSVASAENQPSELYQTAKTLMQPMTEGENPSLDAYLMLAGLAADAEQWEEVVRLLETSRGLPMTRDMRLKVDQHLAAVGLRARTDGQELESVDASAKAAALRLQRSNLPVEQRQQLVAAFSALGMDAEAEKLEGQLAGQSSQYSPSMSRYPGSVNTAPLEKIRDLVKDGKQDAAVRVLEQQLTQLVPTMTDIDNLAYQNYFEDEVKQFRTTVRASNLQDAFLEKMNPGERQSAKAWLSYAVAQEILELDEAAVKAYGTALEINGRQKGAWLRYVALTVKSDSSNFGKVLSQIPEKDAEEILSYLVSSQNSKHLDEKILFARVIVDFLRENSESKLPDWPMAITDLLAPSAQFSRWADRECSHLYASDEEQKELAKELEESTSERKSSRLQGWLDSLEQRRQLHDQICELYLDDPVLTNRAFGCLTASQKSAGKAWDSEEVRAQAIKSLKLSLSQPDAEASDDFSSQIQMIRQMSYGMYEEAEQDWEVLEPLEYLIRDFGNRTDENVQAEATALEQELRSLGGEEIANQWHRQLKLCYAPPEEFPQLAAQLLSTEDGIPYQQINEVLQVWNRRQLTVSLDPLLLPFGDPTKGREYRELEPTVFLPYIQGLQQRGQSDQAATFVMAYMDQLAETLKRPGTEFSWKKVWESRSRKPVVQVMRRFLSSLVEDADCLPVGVRICKELQALDCLRELRYMAYQYTDQPKKLVLALDAIGVFDDLESFDTLSDAQPGSESLLGSLIGQMAYRSDDELDKALDDLDAERFGVRVFKAVLKAERSGVYQALGLELERFRSLSEEKQQLLARYLEEVQAEFSEDDDYDSWPAEAVAARKAVRATMAVLNRSRIDELLAAKRLRDLPCEEHESLRWIGEVIEIASETESDKLEAAFQKGAELLDRSGDFRDRIDGSIQSWLLRRVIASGNYASLRTYLQLAALNEDAVDGMGESEVEEISQFLLKELGVDSGKVETWSNLNREMHRQLPTDSSQILSLIRPLMLASRKLDSSDLEKLVSWVQLEMEASPSDQLVTAMRFALESQWLKKQAEDQIDRKRPILELGDQPQWMEQWLVQQLTDDGMPAALKTDLVTAMLAMPGAMTREGTLKCLETLTPAMEQLDNQTRLAACYRANQLTELNEEGTNVKKAFAKKLAEQYLEDRGPVVWSPVDDTTDLAGGVHVLNLLDSLGEDSLIKRMIRNQTNVFRNAECRVRLVELGRFQDAIQMPGMGLASFISFVEQPLFTSQLQQQLDEYGQQIRKDDERFVELLALNCLTDSELDPPSTQSEQRLKPFLDQFGEMEFRSSKSQTLAALLLTLKGMSSESVKQALADATNDVTADTMELVTASEDENMLYATLGLCLLELREGNIDLLLAFSKHTGAEESSYQADRVNDVLWRLGGDMLCQKFREMSADQREQVLAVVREGSDDRQVLTRSVALHAIAGQLDELTQWLEGHDFDSFDEDAVWLLLKKLASESEDSEVRRQQVLNIWKMIQQTEQHLGTGHFQMGVQESCSSCGKMKMGLQSVIASDLLNIEDVIAIGSELAEIQSENGEIWRQLAQLQIEKKDYQSAKASYEKALEATTEEMDQARHNRQVEYAWVLLQLGETDHAREQVKDVSARELLGDNPRRLKEVLSEAE